jgi:hypothetical protein
MCRRLGIKVRLPFAPMASAVPMTRDPHQEVVDERDLSRVERGPMRGIVTNHGMGNPWVS